LNVAFAAASLLEAYAWLGCAAVAEAPWVMIKILSIDGGGIRGIIPAVVLAEIERRTGRPIADLFDLIAGTSAGGILALGLSIPKNAAWTALHGQPTARHV
jgi:hypothetical protein